MGARDFGEYRLEALIGVGGMGEVFRAYDTQRHRSVAVKLLQDRLSSDHAYRRRFQRESYVAAGLREPHIIPIHDFGELEGRLFIDMRLVDGESVSTLLDEQGPIDPARAVHLIGQVAEALDAAHADGLIHRDIKPSNVLVTAADFVYVVDFGIAHQLDAVSTALTKSDTTIGTLHYMAPERFQNHHVDARVDIYSLTCLLHECLTGFHPFSGHDLPSLMYAHIFSPPPRPSVINPDVPGDFNEVIAQGMAKDPDTRFDTATSLADAARTALAASQPDRSAIRPTHHEQIHLHRPGTPENRTDQTTLDAGTPPQVFSDANSPSYQRPREDAALAKGAAVAVLALLTVLAGIVLDRPAYHESPVAGAIEPPRTTVTAAAAIPPGATSTSVDASVAAPVVGARIPVGPTPGFFVVAPNGRYAYTANQGAESLSVIDTTLNAATITIPIAIGQPRSAVFAPDGRRAYLNIYDSDRRTSVIGVLDTTTNTILTAVHLPTFALTLAISPDGTHLYAPEHGSGNIAVIATVTNTIVATLHVRPNPHSIKFSQDGRRAYIAHDESNIVSVLDTASNVVTATVPVGSSPHSVAISPDQSKVVNVNYDENTASIIDTLTNSVTATIPVGAHPKDVTFAPDGQHAYVVNHDGDTVSVISLRTNEVTATIPTGASPTSVTVSPNGRHAYVTNVDSGDVTVLDTAAE